MNIPISAEPDTPIATNEIGAGILDDVERFLAQFVAYPSAEALVAHVLWIAHTHLMPAWESTPRLAFLSPEPASGKTRALEITELLVPNPVEAVNVSPAYLFRKVGGADTAPTILFDEIDTVFGPKARENEEIRGLLNAGHRRGAVAGRCVVKGKKIVTEEIPAYCAVALAGLDDLPDTIRTRSVVIRMRRRGHDEHVVPYRRRTFCGTGGTLRNRLSKWAADVLDAVGKTLPTLPDCVVDRDADVWEALVAVADAAGGGWPDRARSAAVAFVAASRVETPSLGIRLLADLRAVFGDREAMSTTDIIDALHALDEAPWSELRGKGLDARGLSSRLKKYQVQRRTSIRIGGWVGKGYLRADLNDVWERYLGPPQGRSDTSVTCATTALGNGTLLTAVTDVAHFAARDLLICAHCRGSAQSGNQVLECYVGGEEVWLHRACYWSAMEDAFERAAS